MVKYIFKIYIYLRAGSLWVASELQAGPVSPLLSQWASKRCPWSSLSGFGKIETPLLPRLQGQDSQLMPRLRVGVESLPGFRNARCGRQGAAEAAWRRRGGVARLHGPPRFLFRLPSDCHSVPGFSVPPGRAPQCILVAGHRALPSVCA